MGCYFIPNFSPLLNLYLLLEALRNRVSIIIHILIYNMSQPMQRAVVPQYEAVSARIQGWLALK